MHAEFASASLGVRARERRRLRRTGDSRGTKRSLFPLGGLTVVAGKKLSFTALADDVEELVPEKIGWRLV